MVFASVKINSWVRPCTMGGERLYIADAARNMNKGLTLECSGVLARSEKPFSIENPPTGSTIRTS